MNKKKKRLLVLIVWLVIIFIFSSQDGVESKKLSMQVTSVITGSNFSLWFHAFVRKLAHIFLYFVLALLIDLNTELYFKKHIIVSIIFLVICGILDEVHQYFVPGRAFLFIDIIIDSLSGIVALFIRKTIKKLIK